MNLITDEDKIAIVAEAINATVALERAQSAAGDARKRPRYERAVIALLRLTLDRQPSAEEIAEVLQ